MKIDKNRLKDVKKKRQHKHTKQQKQAAVKKKKCEKALEEVKVKLENLSAEEVNEVLADINLVIDSENIELFEYEMSTLT